MRVLMLMTVEQTDKLGGMLVSNSEIAACEKVANDR